MRSLIRETLATAGQREVTGEVIAFTLALLFVLAFLLILTHAGIKRQFMAEVRDERGQVIGYKEAWYTNLLTFIVIFVGAIAFGAGVALWWFTFNGSGLRPQMLQWLVQKGWNPY